MVSFLKYAAIGAGLAYVSDMVAKSDVAGKLPLPDAAKPYTGVIVAGVVLASAHKFGLL